MTTNSQLPIYQYQAIFQQFTFRNSHVMQGIVLTQKLLKQGYVTLGLKLSLQKKYMVVITNSLTGMKYAFLNWQWMFCSLYHRKDFYRT